MGCNKRSSFENGRAGREVENKQHVHPALSISALLAMAENFCLAAEMYATAFPELLPASLAAAGRFFAPAQLHQRLVLLGFITK